MNNSKRNTTATLQLANIKIARNNENPPAKPTSKTKQKDRNKPFKRQGGKKKSSQKKIKIPNTGDNS